MNITQDYSRMAFKERLKFAWYLLCGKTVIAKNVIQTDSAGNEVVSIRRKDAEAIDAYLRSEIARREALGEK